jgi:4-diphosphocytidyl-2-C-methyl-D-erythritol kinase
MLLYRSPAKINLSLDILSRRPDGYHELQSVVHCIGLYDTISIDMSGSSGLSLRCSDASVGGDDNLCLKAARAWLQTAKSLEGKRSYFPGIRITLDKKIPVGAGLGGGSGNAATTLLALNEYFDTPLTIEQLNEVAASLGADVPLFLRGGCMLMEGIGEQLQPLPAVSGWVVVIKPTQHASTPAVYREFDALQVESSRDTPGLIAAMQTSDLSQIAANLGNDLAAAAQNLGIDTELPIRLLKQNGALNAQMSGSGAASFGLFETETQAERARQQILDNESWPEQYQIFAAPLVPSGVELLEADE